MTHHIKMFIEGIALLLLVGLAQSLFITGVPSNIPLSYRAFARHIRLLVDDTPVSPDKDTLYGYSCRALFETFMYVVTQRKGSKVHILTTGMHHKSWIEIMQRYAEDVSFIQLSDNLAHLVTPTEAEVAACDLIVLTHLFGQPFQVDEIAQLAKKHNKWIVVDNVLAELDESFDIQFWSTGQDKRPVAIGGGYCKSPHTGLLAEMEERMQTYTRETWWERLCKIVNTFWLWHLYTSTVIHACIHLYCTISSIPLSSVVTGSRKNNPGFEHSAYLKYPSVALMRSIHTELHAGGSPIKERYACLWRYYLHALTPEAIAQFYPYYQGMDAPISMPYNQVWTSDAERFVGMCDTARIACIRNDNYRAFPHAPSNTRRYTQQMVNILSVVGQSPANIKKLASFLNGCVENQTSHVDG